VKEMGDIGNNLWWCDAKYCRTRFTLTKEQQRQKEMFPESSLFHLVMNCPLHEAEMSIKYDVAVEIAKRERLKEKGRLITDDHICLNTIYDRATKGDELCIRLWQEIKKESLRRAKIKVKVK